MSQIDFDDRPPPAEPDDVSYPAPEHVTGELVRPEPIAASKQGFGTSEIALRKETASTAIAERAKAEVQARYIVALQRPRSVDEARVRILKHCQRPRFAAAARYAKPVGGKKIEGPSIRFVETALQEYGNVLPECMVVFDDPEQRIVRVAVTDLERNITHTKDVVIKKTVERSKLSPGQRPISQRLNSYGKMVYEVPATEDDLLNRQGALESKAIRTLGLRILPADIVDEAMAIAVKTQESDAAQDPDAKRKAIVDAFAKLGVMPKDLAEYLGHDLGQTTPAEIVDLQAVYGALNDREGTWADVMEVRRQERGDVEEPKKPTHGQTAVKERLAARRNGKKAETDGAAAE